MMTHNYPLNEFKSHFLSVVENRVTGPGGTGEPLLDVALHLEPFIFDNDDRKWKTIRLHAALSYLAQNIGAFADDGYVQLHSGEATEVNPILIESLHAYFSSEEIDTDLCAVEVLRTAKELSRDIDRR